MYNVWVDQRKRKEDELRKSKSVYREKIEKIKKSKLRD